jgi:hypothetical protein
MSVRTVREDAEALQKYTETHKPRPLSRGCGRKNAQPDCSLQSKGAHAQYPRVAIPGVILAWAVVIFGAH